MHCSTLKYNLYYDLTAWCLPAVLVSHKGIGSTHQICYLMSTEHRFPVMINIQIFITFECIIKFRDLFRSSRGEPKEKSESRFAPFPSLNPTSGKYYQGKYKQTASYQTCHCKGRAVYSKIYAPTVNQSDQHIHLANQNAHAIV